MSADEVGVNVDDDRAPEGIGGRSGESALSVKDLVKTFHLGGGFLARDTGEVSAVAGVSFDIAFGRTMGLVGESGCGKSTTARCILRLIEPTSGDIFLRQTLEDGGYATIDIVAADKKQLRTLRRRMQIVFQDPYASLDPRMTVGSSIGELLIVHTDMSRDDRVTRIGDLLQLVGMSSQAAERYPHEFSGGQRQRIGIARALVLSPDFLILDEPVSALDVSIQAQILNLLEELQQNLGLTYLFIAHDLAVVRHICDETAVMYLGKIVEATTTDALFSKPMHPYTHALLSAVPVPDPKLERQRSRILLEGDVPSALNPPTGCRFHTRCSVGKDKEICKTQEPPLRELLPGHYVACHFPEAKQVL